MVSSAQNYLPCQLANSAVDCISGGELLGVEAVAVDWLGGQSIVFVVILVFKVISIVISIIIGIIVIGISIRKSSLKSSTMLVVD